MTEIRYIDRSTYKECTEKVYGRALIEALYGNSLLSRFLSFFFLPLFSHVNFLSTLYGMFQKSTMSKFKIAPFIREFNIDTSAFLDPPSSFHSFNDFFVRKLNPAARPIAQEKDIAVLPADGRYLVYENIQTIDGFLIKGEKFDLNTLLHNSSLAQNYTSGSMVIARLAPVDYHRFHFPTNCLPEKPELVNGPLYSVNPIALQKNIHILSRNKRMITPLQTKHFGKILYIEIGATNVGSIIQTFAHGEPYGKGDEKGYFSFGGSCIVLLFEPGKIQFSQDLLDASYRKMETLAHFGQPMGRALSPL